MYGLSDCVFPCHTHLEVIDKQIESEGPQEKARIEPCIDGDAYFLDGRLLQHFLQRMVDHGKKKQEG